ncbi:MAG: methyltransferase domain-containing protein [Eubacteriaceae bacterium]|nr:methyltransferase domain-containing protein [Eubacteriaceae bacterium]
MIGWLNWREIEKNNDWGVRDKDDATAAMWNNDAAGWEQRTLKERDYNRRQVEALELTEQDDVLDVCCGTGPLTEWIAPRVKRVTAFDFSENMLAFVKEKAEKMGLANVEYLQGNFNTMIPGVDAPRFDVAVTRHSPAQGNILRFSRWATKRCYSLNAVYGAALLSRSKTASPWIRSASENGGKMNFSTRPDGRMYGFNVHFNLLYDLGANPSVDYVENRTVFEKASKEELYTAVNQGRPFSKEGFERWLTVADSKISEKDGVLIYTDIQKMSVLSWNPSEIDWDRAQELDI